MNTGIYRIEIGDYFYIGQSIELDKRKSTHLNNLRKGTHCNRMMQSVYNKYQNFSFKVMLNCGADQLDMLEQSALDVCYGDEDCMNLTKDAISPMLGRTHTLEARKNMSAAGLGRKFTPEHKRRITASNLGVSRNVGPIHAKYSHTVYHFVHDDGVEETCTQYELRMKYSLDSSGISRLVSGKAKTCKGWRVK